MHFICLLVCVVRPVKILAEQIKNLTVPAGRKFALFSSVTWLNHWKGNAYISKKKKKKTEVQTEWTDIDHHLPVRETANLPWHPCPR